MYWLGRQIMGPAAAGAATLQVMSLCLVKPAGNYILPYSYNALHGATLALITLALLVATLKRMNGPGRSTTPGVAFALAGVVAGLSTLAKTEMGFAAVTAGIAAALLAGYPNLRQGLRFAIIFVAPAIILTIGAYALVSARVGWSCSRVRQLAALLQDASGARISTNRSPVSPIQSARSNAC